MQQMTTHLLHLRSLRPINAINNNNNKDKFKAPYAAYYEGALQSQ